jgi:hypothetical protein
LDLSGDWKEECSHGNCQGECEVKPQRTHKISSSEVKGKVWLEVGAVEKKERKIGMRFQVADVVKPLVSVKRLTEKGNQVCFGEEEGESYIENKVTGDRVMLKPNGRGSYLMVVTFDGGECTEIVVDSGAEENVCPRWWGYQGICYTCGNIGHKASECRVVKEVTVEPDKENAPTEANSVSVGGIWWINQVVKVKNSFEVLVRARRKGMKLRSFRKKVLVHRLG